MLKDRYFYPLATAFIAAMIWYALSKGNHENLTIEGIRAEGFTVQEEYLSKLTASYGTSFTYVKKSEKEQAYVILKSNIARDSPPSLGIFSPLAPNYHQAFAAQNLRITVRARQGKSDPLTYFDVGYFTANSGSGWIRKTLTPEWKNYIIEYTPKLSTDDSDLDYLGVWPGEKGSRKTMEIQSMKIDVLPKLRR